MKDALRGHRHEEMLRWEGEAWKKEGARLGSKSDGARAASGTHSSEEEGHSQVFGPGPNVTVERAPVG